MVPHKNIVSRVRRRAATRRAHERRIAQRADGRDRERLKREWLEPILADLDTQGAREMAAQYHVSLRFAGQLAGLIVNLDSFLDKGYVYASQQGLAKYIKNANGERISERHVRRGVAFLEARQHLRVERCRGYRNRMYPLPASSAPAADCDRQDMVSADEGHEVRYEGTPSPTESVMKPVLQTCIPPSPPSNAANGETAASSEAYKPGQRTREGREIIENRLARRIGVGDLAEGYLMLMNLSDGYLDQLVTMERRGTLGDDEISLVRAAVNVQRR